MPEQTTCATNTLQLLHAHVGSNPVTETKEQNGETALAERTPVAAAAPYDSALEAEEVARGSQEDWRQQPAEAQAQDAETQGDAVPAAPSQVYIKMPEKVRARSRSSEAAPKPSGVCVFVRMPNDVRRKRALSRESGHNGVGSKPEESDMLYDTGKTVPPTAEEGLDTPEVQPAEPHDDNSAVQLNSERTADGYPATEASPATERVVEPDVNTEANSAELVGGATTAEMEAQENTSAAIATKAKDDAAPVEGGDARIEIKNDKEKARCCTVM
ncbi:hypothetical protein GH5_01672 [Leishmania sp. Ghana 2012 LV757]|uniref:hypothetical protein n=1 Tax=Leishmania sp. Ghana 2012 LV757 TaxID=2803181 RepID=UPI001B41B979|nr:hypothetical protein GH5_01672 [Leishmania sp. Ghana 2012 LV757]